MSEPVNGAVPEHVKAVADKYAPRTESAGANRLPIIATDINKYVRIEKTSEQKAEKYDAKAEEARSAANGARLLIGELLIEAKSLVPHGRWLPWLRDNCALSERTAQLYMRVAGNKEKIEEVKSVAATDLGLMAAAASIAKPRLPPEPAEKSTGDLGEGSPDLQAQAELWSAIDNALRSFDQIRAEPEEIVAAVPPYQNEKFAVLLACARARLDAVERLWTSNASMDELKRHFCTVIFVIMDNAPKAEIDSVREELAGRLDRMAKIATLFRNNATTA